MALSSYQKIALTSDIVLTWPFSYAGGLVVEDINDITPNAGGWTIAMPNASLTTAGQNMLFRNVGSYNFEIIANDLTTVITTVDAGDVVTLFLTDASTTNGTWGVLYGSGINAITAFTASSSDSSITITDGVVTPPGGTINFQLPASIFNLDGVVTTGFPIILTTAPLTWSTVTLVAGENIAITNPDGTGGDPVINLDTVITGLSSADIGGITISGNIIDASAENGDLSLSTNGTGVIFLNGVSVDTSANITEVNNLTVNGVFNNAFMPKAWGNFTDTIVGDSNSIVKTDSANITSITGSAGTYTANFTNDQANINYGVQIAVGTNGGDMPFVATAYVTVKDVNYVTFVVVDASGELVASAPYGVTFTIWSSI